MHDSSVRTMAISDNSRYLFTADCNGYLKHWDLKAKKLVKEYIRGHEGWISSMVVVQWDDENFEPVMITGDNLGCLKERVLDTQKLVKDYKKIHNGRIKSMFLSR